MTTQAPNKILMAALLLAGSFITILNQTLMITAIPADYGRDECDGKLGAMADDRLHARQRRHDSRQCFFNRTIYY